MEYDSKLCTGNKESAYEMWNKCVQKSDAVLDAVIDIFRADNDCVYIPICRKSVFRPIQKTTKKNSLHFTSAISGFLNKPLKSLQNKTGKGI